MLENVYNKVGYNLGWLYICIGALGDENDDNYILLVISYFP